MFYCLTFGENCNLHASTLVCYCQYCGCWIFSGSCWLAASTKSDQSNAGH